MNYYYFIDNLPVELVSIINEYADPETTYSITKIDEFKKYLLTTPFKYDLTMDEMKPNDKNLIQIKKLICIIPLLCKKQIKYNCNSISQETKHVLENYIKGHYVSRGQTITALVLLGFGYEYINGSLRFLCEALSDCKSIKNEYEYFLTTSESIKHSHLKLTSKNRYYSKSEYRYSRNLRIQF